jgi:hypothetical protein
MICIPLVSPAVFRLAESCIRIPESRVVRIRIPESSISASRILWGGNEKNIIESEVEKFGKTNQAFA